MKTALVLGGVSMLLAVVTPACGPGGAERLTQLSNAGPVGDQGKGPVQGSSPAPPANPRPLSHWRLDISSAPVDARSADFIAFINSPETKIVHPGFGREVAPGSVEIYGMPVIRVNGSQPKKAVEFQWAWESDGVDRSTGQRIPFYPIPDEAIWTRHLIQGGEPGNVDRRDHDRHMLILQTDQNHLFELFKVFFDQSAERWRAVAGAFFDLNDPLYRRTEGWTSADASGMAIYPGLLQYDEAFGADEITHAIRVTVRATNGYVYPASHQAGNTPGALPMGARLRLKASVDISRFAPPIQSIFRAMKKYGLIVADNGDDMYIAGTYDPRWEPGVLNPAFHALSASDFEVVQLGFRGR